MSDPQNQNNASSDPLPSWNDSAVKKSILDFIAKTTLTDSPDFIPADMRVACFDNDGTLWAEQPLYFQLAFALDRIKALAPQHPEWKTMQPFQNLLEGNVKAAFAEGEKAILQILSVTHTGITTDEFQKIVKDWMTSAVHPITGKHYYKMIYQPMTELLSYLRANDYKTFIVSGGGADFMRSWVMQVFGIPEFMVVGSSGKVEYEVLNGKPELFKLPEINFIDDKAGKPVGIHEFIGLRPVFSVGNSDGDYEMLQWTCAGDGPRFGMIIHHTDAVREWAYDRQSPIGHLEKALDDATKYGWHIMDMKNDWNKIFPDS